jgi:hypothetical protein
MRHGTVPSHKHCSPANPAQHTRRSACKYMSGNVAIRKYYMVFGAFLWIFIRPYNFH